MSAATELPRLLAGADPHGGATLAAHLAVHGLPSLAVDAAALRDEVERAGLHGRGGAAFPTATKLNVVAQRRRRPIVVANGAEGEPASEKDGVLMAQAPQLVLDGVQLASTAVSAVEAIVCVRGNAHGARDALARALHERMAAGRDAVPTRIVPIPDGYVAGEETALVNQLDGGPPLPTSTPPRPFERGVGGRPTLIQNVETLAHVALIARYGADWFRSLGTAAEPGTALVTLSGAVARPGVREVALGTPLDTLVAHGGGDLESARAVLLGGYFGTWLTAGTARAATLETTSLRPLGASLGCGVVAVLGPEACGVAETARLVRWLAGQSAGQCGPCVHGLAAIAGQLEALVDGRAARARRQPPGKRRGERPEDPLARLHRWCGDVAGRGACRHPDGVVRLVGSALRAFEGDFDDHLRHGPCEGCMQRPTLPLSAPSVRTRRAMALA